MMLTEVLLQNAEDATSEELVVKPPSYNPCRL